MHSLLIILSLFLVSADKPVAPLAPRLIAFHGQGCRPCREMRPILRRLEADRVKVERIDIDNEAAAKRWKVRAVPTFILVDCCGQEKGRIVGKTTLEKLRKLLCLPERELRK